MPQSTVLPAPQIEWEGTWYQPSMHNNNVVASGLITAADTWMYPSNWGANVPSISWGEMGNVGGTGVVVDYRMHRGRPCGRMSTTSATSGGAWVPCPFWQAGFGAASGWNAGAGLIPSSVVAVIDIHIASSTALAAWPEDGTGFWFVPKIAALNCGTCVPRGAAPLGGFGLFANNDGAGNLEWEYLATGAGVGPVVLERSPAPAGSVPDVTDWSTVRFIIVSAGGGREPNLSVQVNGIDWIVDREFGSAQLSDLSSLDATALGWCFGRSVQGGAGAQILWNLSCRWGRYTPSGQEIQAN